MDVVLLTLWPLWFALLGIMFSPGCGCCGGCEFENSDDSLYGLDEFNSLDASWDMSWVPAGVTIRAESGELIASSDEGSGGSSTARVLQNESGAVAKLIVQSTLRWITSHTSSGIIVLNNSVRAFGIVRAATGYIVQAFGGLPQTIAMTAADGDRLTMKVESITAGWRACFFVNGALVVIRTAASYTFASSFSHGVEVTFPASGGTGYDAAAWDDYTAERS